MCARGAAERCGDIMWCRAGAQAVRRRWVKAAAVGIKETHNLVTGGINIKTDKLCTKKGGYAPNRVSFALIIAALLVASSLLVAQEGMVLGLLSFQTMGVVGYVIAAIIGIWLVISIIRSRHI